MSQEDEIKQSLDLIQKAVIALDKKIELQSRRIEMLEQQKDAGVVLGNSSESNLQAAQSISQTDASYQNKLKQAWQENTAPIDDLKNSGIEISKSSSDSLEENIGGKLFMKIGMAALFLGISFFLKYAFDNNWIGETGRVMIGIFIGLIMLSIGEKTIRKYVNYGQMITGGGIAVLYLSIFSAYNFYHLIGSGGAFFAMIIVTGIGIALSLRYDALALMMAAILGGFLTPIMASSGENNQIGLLLYVVLLDLAILTVSIFKKWRAVNVAGFVGTIILFSAWAEKYYTKYDLSTTMLFLTIFFLIYSISSLIYNLVQKEKSTGFEQMLTLFSGVVYFSSSYGILDDRYHTFMGFFAIVLAIYYFLWAYLVRTITPEDENLHGFLAFLTVGFVTIAIPIQFKQNVITIAWAIEAALLLIIGTKLRRNAIIFFAITVFGFSILRYLFIDISSYGQVIGVIFNKAFFTAVAIIIAAYLMSYVAAAFADSDEKSAVNRKVLIAMFVIVANLVTIFAISREIMTSYERQISQIYKSQNQSLPNGYYGSASYGNKYDDYYSSSSYKNQQAQIVKLQNKSSITLSIFWLVYAIILLTIGVVGKYKGVRVGGLALLILAILKLFFVDLWSLGTLYRIISSISLGVVLMAISFVYQKYKDAIKEII